MLYNTMHNRAPAAGTAGGGRADRRRRAEPVHRAAEPVHRGLLGLCQLIRTLLQTYLGLSFGTYDIAGILYFLLNIPLLIVGYRDLGRGLAVRTIICTVSYSLFYSIIPIPTQPSWTTT